VLRKTLEREMELSELKSRFVSMVSHEFRTPLSIILMNVDIIRKYNDRLSIAEKEKYMASVHTSIQRMTDLLDDVLTISRAEMGRLEFRPEPLNIDSFCRSVVDEIRTTANAALTFEYEARGTCRSAIADKKLLRLILTNLVSNAAKYSEPGGTVWVTLTCDEDQLVVDVTDEGIGIPEQEQTRVFETFFRATNTGRMSGTGLGLAIAKQCVEYHHGTIAFESVEGKGSTFTLTLPRVTEISEIEDDSDNYGLM
jgi:signal transduction histidine kinase